MFGKMKSLPKPVWEKLEQCIINNLSCRQKQYLLREADDPGNDVQTALEAVSYLCLQYANLSSGNYDFHDVTTVVNEAVVKAGLHWSFVHNCEFKGVGPDYSTIIHAQQKV